MDSLPRLVLYRQKQLVGSLLVVAAMLVAVPPLAWFLGPHVPIVLQAGSIIASVGCLAYCPPYLVHFGKRVFTREPAFAIYPDGLIIGLLFFEKPFFMTWKEIECVYERAQICIQP